MIYKKHKLEDMGKNAILLKIMTLTRKKKTASIIPPSKWIPETLFQVIQKLIPIACVDLILLRKNRNITETLLVKRKIYPEKNKWCLIGGRILKNEKTKTAVNRQAKNELGVSVKIIPPWSTNFPFATYNDPLSDKQKHFVVLTFPVVVIKGNIKPSGPEFSEARWFPLHKIPANLGFHHYKVLRDFRKITLPYVVIK